MNNLRRTDLKQKYIVHRISGTFLTKSFIVQDFISKPFIHSYFFLHSFLVTTISLFLRINLFQSQFYWKWFQELCSYDKKIEKKLFSSSKNFNFSPRCWITLLPHVQFHLERPYFATCTVPLRIFTRVSYHMYSSSQYAWPYFPTCTVPARIWTSISWLMCGW